MAAPMQPAVNIGTIPVAQDAQARGTSRALVLCGRSVTNCCAHTAFIAGYGLAFTGLGISIWYQSIVVGVFSAIVAVPIGVSQCFWSRYSNVANAAEDVDDAARGAREAAANVQIAAVTILKTSGDVSRAASRTEKAAGDIQVVVAGDHLATLEASVTEYKETSQVIGRENTLLKEQLEELKGMLSPLMALVSSFRSSLSALKIGIKAGTPLLASFIDLEKRMEKVAVSLQGELETTSTSIQAKIEEAAQLAILTVQIIEQKNRELSQELRAATGDLQRSVTQVADLSQRIGEGDAARQALLVQIDAQQRENTTLQERLEKTLRAIDTQRRGYEEAAAAGVGGASLLLGSTDKQIEIVNRVTALIQECTKSLVQQRAAEST